MGLIGVGGIGQYHLKCLKILHDHGTMRLVAAADPGMDSFVSDLAAFEHMGVRVYKGYKAMLDSEAGLEAVQIATPVPLHFEMAKDCIDRNLFVYLEKPPVPLIQQLDELIARDRNTRVAVGFQYISSAIVRTLKEWILEGNAGTLREFRVTAGWPRMDSYYQRANWAGKMMCDGKPVFDGPATNALSHVIHTVMYLAGASFPTFAAPDRIQGEFYRSRPIESYDTVCLRGWLNTGPVFTCAFTHSVIEARPFEILVRGTRGWARLTQDGEKLETSDGTHILQESRGDEFLMGSNEDFLALTRGELPPRSSLADTRGFTLATNGGLISSAGIHDVPPKFVRRYTGESGPTYELNGLSDAMESCFREGLLFSELGIPWARQTNAVSLQGMDFLDLAQYISHFDPDPNAAIYSGSPDMVQFANP